MSGVSTIGTVVAGFSVGTNGSVSFCPSLLVVCFISETLKIQGSG